MEIGRYAYRFKGHFVRGGQTHSLAGIGYLTLKSDGLTLVGDQVSSTIDIEGASAPVELGQYILAGTYTDEASSPLKPLASAELVFTSKTNVMEEPMADTFAVVHASPDGRRIWFLTTNPRSSLDNKTAVFDHVSGEAIWISE